MKIILRAPVLFLPEEVTGLVSGNFTSTQPSSVFETSQALKERSSCGLMPRSLTSLKAKSCKGVGVNWSRCSRASSSMSRSLSGTRSFFKVFRSAGLSLATVDREKYHLNVVI